MVFSSVGVQLASMSEVISDTHICYHCGTSTRRVIRHADKDFCCDGCRSVYILLEQNDLCQYYDLSDSPTGNQALGLDAVANEQSHKFAFLDSESIAKRLYVFQSDTECHIHFYLPQVHCSSCVYLLENLHKLMPGVKASELQFSKKILKVSFDPTSTSARRIAQFLTGIGYEPYFSLSDLQGEYNQQNRGKLAGDAKHRLFRLGVAGFCFGNIMLLSFPEYFEWGSQDLDGLKSSFTLLNLLLISPVMLYSAQEFYRLAWGGLKKRYLTIDLPIVLAMMITLGRSLYEVANHLGPGYFDSLSGIVFFMLLGRYLQDRTHQRISFDRDYTSYFPLSASVWKEGRAVSLPLTEVKQGDELMIHNQELIPVDARLAYGEAHIDYSFVTGESIPVSVKAGDWLYAGGRQLAGSIRVIAEKPMSQGYLVSLWNKSKQKQDGIQAGSENEYVHRASQWFTVALFAVAISAAVYWSMVDPSKVWTAVTSVLIVACPCALLLSVTFTHGHLLTLLAKNGLYVRGATALESWRKVRVSIFDKTGTLTQSGRPKIAFEGAPLDAHTWDAVAALALESVHPYARQVGHWLDRPKVPILQVENHVGSGVLGCVDGVEYRMGNRRFVGLSEGYVVTSDGHLEKMNATSLDSSAELEQGGSEIWCSVNNRVVGRFLLVSSYRDQLRPMLLAWREVGSLFVLSGDTDRERNKLTSLLPQRTTMYFEQKPHEKQAFIQEQKARGGKVMMVGDGLNDAGALMEADFGIAISEDMGYFSPGCDAILLGDSLPKLHALWRMVKRGKRVIWWSFAVSIAYNVVGLSFAVRGELNPMIAAILMPASSISIVLFTWLAILWGGRRERLSL
jgi:Cu+-exporting ATPase